MPNPPLPDTAPSSVAYFTVTVPFSRTTDETETPRRDRAAEIVDRYLYRGSVTTIDTVPDAEVFEVTVRREFWPGENPTTALQNQRDRYTSGLYGTSEPVCYFPTFAVPAQED